MEIVLTLSFFKRLRKPSQIRTWNRKAQLTATLKTISREWTKDHTIKMYFFPKRGRKNDRTTLSEKRPGIFQESLALTKSLLFSGKQ